MRVPLAPALVCYCHNDALNKPPQTQWLNPAIIYSHYYIQCIISAPHCSFLGLNLFHVFLISASNSDGRCMREQGNNTHTFKLLLTLLLLASCWPKQGIRLIKNQKWGKIVHLWWEILFGYGKDVYIERSKELGPVIYCTFAFSSTLGILKLLKIVCKGLTLWLQCVFVFKSLKLCPILCDSMDYIVGQDPQSLGISKQEY